MNDEWSILPSHEVMIDGHLYVVKNRRESDYVRHEVFFGSSNRKKSIQYRLYVFIKPYDHNMSRFGVHCAGGNKFNMHLKRMAQIEAKKVYGWNDDDFRKIFGKSYL